ncbi:hypothetical protein K7711_08845 [Nocardia sp. CA2R105]|uniref:hypothetical protein n=1 Tax=Nocardia coffeae TaxID=2873381 RepID=UPI001CA6B008|nr:hypothetical protein [Nocardia coffeae]MBY8856581.1 hypothetical protein [Nocardia coffeae]
MTGTQSRTLPPDPGTAALRQLRTILDQIARDLDTLHQIEQIQQQHQIALTSALTVQARLHTKVETLQQALERLDDHITTRARPRAPGTVDETH